MVRSLVVCSALLTIVATSAVRAQDARARAAWSYDRGVGAGACPDDDALRTAIATRLGYTPFDPAAEMRVRVSIAAADGGLAARIDVERPDRPPGTRELTSTDPDCHELADALVLAVALAIDPAALAERAEPANEEPTEETTAAPAPATAPAPAGPSTAPAAVRPSAPLRVAGSAGGTLAIGALPAPALGLVLAFDLGWPAFRVGLGARAYPGASTDVEGGSVDAALYAVELVPCARVAIAYGCGVLSIGVVAGGASGLAETRSTTSAYAAAGVRAGVEIPLGARIALRVELDALAQLARTTLLVDDREAWSMPSVAISAAALLVIPFG